MRGLPLYESDATYNANVSNSFDVKKFPSLYYKKGNSSGLYHGDRTTLGVKALITKLFNRVQPVVEDYSSLSSIFSPGHVVFVFKEKTSNDNVGSELLDYHQVNQIMTRNHLDYDFAVVSNHFDENRKYMLSKLEVGFPKREIKYYEKNGSIDEFLARNNHALVVEFDAFKYSQALKTSDYLLLLILSEDTSMVDGFEMFVHDVSSESVQHVSFGYMKGGQWRRYLADYDVFPPSLLLIDVKNDQHISISIRRKDEMRSLLQKLVDDLHQNQISWVSSHPAGMIRLLFFKIKSYYPWSLMAFLPIAGIILNEVTHQIKIWKKKRD